MQRARLTDTLYGSEAAVARWREVLALDPGQPAANMAVGAYLLSQEDEAGLEHLEPVDRLRLLRGAVRGAAGLPVRGRSPLYVLGVVPGDEVVAARGRAGRPEDRPARNRGSRAAGRMPRRGPRQRLPLEPRGESVSVPRGELPYVGRGQGQRHMVLRCRSYDPAARVPLHEPVQLLGFSAKLLGAKRLLQGRGIALCFDD